MNEIHKESSAHLPVDLLRTFVAVADYASFTKAARQVHRTQSAVSMQVQRLEGLMDHALFERSGRAVVLTAQGERMLEHARRILAVHDQAVADLMTPHVRGRVRLGSPEDYASQFLPRVLASFAAAHPGVLVDVLSRPSSELCQALERGELDLCVGTWAGQPKNTTLLRTESLVWVTGRSSRAHTANPLPLALFYEGCIYRRWATGALAKAGRDYRTVYESPSLACVLAAVRAGLAVAPVAKANVHGLADVKELGAKDGFPPLPSAAVCLHAAAGAQSEAVERLAQAVREGFADT